MRNNFNELFFRSLFAIKLTIRHILTFKMRWHKQYSSWKSCFCVRRNNNDATNNRRKTCKEKCRSFAELNRELFIWSRAAMTEKAGRGEERHRNTERWRAPMMMMMMMMFKTIMLYNENDKWWIRAKHTRWLKIECVAWAKIVNNDDAVRYCSVFM